MLWKARWLVVVALASAALATTGVALAARAPTLPEREAITRALPLFFRNTPAECVWIEIRVSRDPRYALADPTPLNARRTGSRCARYASDGFFVLRRERRWRVVYEGSVPPRCKLRIPRDLVGCTS